MRTPRKKLRSPSIYFFEDEKNVECEPVREEGARVVESERDKNHAEPMVEKKKVEPPQKPEMGKEEGESSKMKADGDEGEEIYPKAEEPVEEEKKREAPKEEELEKKEAVKETPPRQPPEKVEKIGMRASVNAREMKNEVDDDMHASSDEAKDKIHEANKKSTEKYNTIAENDVDAGEETRNKPTPQHAEEAMRRENQERGVKETTCAATTEAMRPVVDKVTTQKTGEPTEASLNEKQRVDEEKLRKKDKEVKEWIKARDSLEAYMNNLKNRSNEKYKLAGKLEADEKDEVKMTTKEALKRIGDKQNMKKEATDMKETFEMLTKAKPPEAKYLVATPKNIEYDKIHSKIAEEVKYKFKNIFVKNNAEQYKADAVKDIYVTDESKNAEDNFSFLNKNPKEKRYEVVYMADATSEYTVRKLKEYDQRKVSDEYWKSARTKEKRVYGNIWFGKHKLSIEAKCSKTFVDGKWRAATYDTRKRVKFKED